MTVPQLEPLFSMKYTKPVSIHICLFYFKYKHIKKTYQLELWTAVPPSTDR